MSPMQTPIAYMGGKQRLGADLAHALPEHGIYVEPFAGGLAVLFAKRKVALEVVNDLDESLVTFWRVLRDDPDELARAVWATPISRKEFELAKREPKGPTDLETARRLFLRFDQSFSSGGRGWSWRNATLGDRAARIAACTERLKGVIIESMDALELIPRWDLPGCLIYCDPPYHPDTRDGGIYKHDVDAEFHERLVETLNGLKQATYVLSGYAHPVYEGLHDAEVHVRSQNRDAAARKGSTGVMATESIYAPRGVLAWQLTLE